MIMLRTMFVLLVVLCFSSVIVSGGGNRPYYRRTPQRYRRRTSGEEEREPVQAGQNETHEQGPAEPRNGDLRRPVNHAEVR